MRLRVHDVLDLVLGHAQREQALVHVVAHLDLGLLLSCVLDYEKGLGVSGM